MSRGNITSSAPSSFRRRLYCDLMSLLTLSSAIVRHLCYDWQVSGYDAKRTERILFSWKWNCCHSEWQGVRVKRIRISGKLDSSELSSVCWTMILVKSASSSHFKHISPRHEWKHIRGNLCVAPSSNQVHSRNLEISRSLMSYVKKP